MSRRRTRKRLITMQPNRKLSMPRPLISALVPLILNLPLIAPPARAEDIVEFSNHANAVCLDIIAARDYEVMEGAQSGMRDLLADTVRGNEPPASERAEALSALLEASNDEFARTIDALRAIAPEEPEAARHLETIFADAQYKIDVREARIALLANAGSAEWEWPMETALDVREGPSDLELQQAWDALGFTERECQFVFYSDGYPADFAAYWAEVARICSAIYDRRHAQAFALWSEDALDAFIAAQSGAPFPDVAASLESLAAEWAQTAQDLAAIEPSATPFPEKWEALLASAQSNADVYFARAEAVGTGDGELSRAAFLQTRFGGFDAVSVGMEQSSCAGLASTS